MHVLLLAGGSSTRVWPLSNKVFFEFLGKSIIEHQVDILENNISKNITIVCNPDIVDQVKNKFKNKSNISFSIQKNPNGIHHGIYSAKNLIKKNEELLIICSNDIVDKKIFEKIVNKTKNNNSDVFLCGKKVDKYFPGGYIKKNVDNKIIKIIEKPKEGEEPSDIVTIMIHYYRKAEILMNKIENHTNLEYEELIQKIIKEKAVKLIEHNDFWQAIKYPWHFLSIKKYFLNKIKNMKKGKNCKISDKAVINGPVYIGDNVEIMDFCVINGPVYIGDNSKVANFCLIRDSHIGKNCVIGGNSEIARSYIRNNCRTHQNYIGDSVIDNNNSFGAGFKTANLRLDEEDIFSIIKNVKINSNRNKLGLILGENCRIGVNSTSLPGIKIGSNNFISSNINCKKDIECGKFTKQKNDLIEIKNIKTTKLR